MMSTGSTVAQGSSPRGRGKRDKAEGGLGGVRLIPAWAGKTSTGLRLTSCPWAHPRVGGENGGFS